MPKVFVTRVYEFDARKWPLVTFRNEGDRDNLARESHSEDDVVAFIGTAGDNTAEEDKGRLLGMVTFESNKLRVTKNILSEEVYNEKRNYNDDGSFKWPYAMPAKQAWHFSDPKPFATDIIEQKLHGMNSAVRTVKLNEEDAERILKLPKEEIEINKSIFKDGDVEIDTPFMKPSKGPAPAEYIATMERTFEGSGCTYALQYGKTSIWKIGRSKNIEKRIEEINKHIPYQELDCDKWSIGYNQKWDSEEKAHIMEQEVLNMYETEQTKGERTHGERVRSSKEEIENVWMEIARKVKEI